MPTKKTTAKKTTTKKVVKPAKSTKTSVKKVIAPVTTPVCKCGENCTCGKDCKCCCCKYSRLKQYIVLFIIIVATVMATLVVTKDMCPCKKGASKARYHRTFKNTHEKTAPAPIANAK